jgi:hypothetical protein
LCYPWVKGIQVYLNKGPCPDHKGDNHKNVKLGWGHLKVFSRTKGPEKVKFTRKLSDIIQKQVY